jgi:DNA-binding NtrC family response regulator
VANEPTLPRGRPELVRGGTLEAPGGRTVTVGAEPITIGRDASADLALDDPSVSALHCELRATPRGVAIRDLGSTNGTRVENLLVSEAVLIGPCTLHVGDSEVRFVSARSPSIGAPDEDATELGALRGGSSAMRRVYQMLRRVGPTDLSVLVTGETGTGKELAARALHDLSSRARGPFVVIDCSALPGTLAESILFGHEKGAFTGAVARASGAFQSAHGGTVFLDELGELPDELQPKLLRAVAERSVQRVGSNKYETVDVRVVAATRRDLRREINARRFREDLYFRIAQTRVEMPPLRSRVEDIPAIVAEACARVGQPAAAGRVTGYIQGRLGRYDWPGNVRELVNVASVLAALGNVASDDLLPLESAPAASAGAAHAVSAKAGEIGDASAESFARAKRAFEETYFRRMLESSEGNLSEVARRVGLARHQVRAHLKKLGLSRGAGKDE